MGGEQRNQGEEEDPPKLSMDENATRNPQRQAVCVLWQLKKEDRLRHPGSQAEAPWRA